MIEKLPKITLVDYPESDVFKNTPQMSQMMWNKINETVEAINRINQINKPIVQVTNTDSFARSQGFSRPQGDE